MASVGECDEVESKVEKRKSDIEDRVVKIGKIFDKFQSSGFLRFFIREENFRV